jgi:hypothetical protein
MIATRSPWDSAALAVARPIPREPPVITQRFEDMRLLKEAGKESEVASRDGALREESAVPVGRMMTDQFPKLWVIRKP